jgi:two-component system, chemotaxis family, CheB/CheR fusion protein
MKKQYAPPSRCRKTGATARSAVESHLEREETQTVRTSHPTKFPVVAIGASAGGLDAVQRFFRAMPAGGGQSFVVIVHLDPTQVSHLPELLGRCTQMPVTQAQEGEAVRPDHVHVIPPDSCLTLARGVLRLTDRVERPGIPMPIDRFFCSLAEDQEDLAIGILLSGSGSDGTLGLKEIKAAGGLMLVQTPETAEHEGMPQSAIATGLVDYILRVEEMPAVLLQYVAHAHADGAVMSLPLDTGKDPLAAILALLQARGKADFRCYKPQMLLRRIRRRMGLAHRAQITDYLQFLRNTPHETDALIRDLLISVTSFFREPEAWQVLDAEVILRLLAARPSDAGLRVWVPSCASGEEAYSIGMLLLEHVKTIDHSGKIQIFATAIDREALDVGRAGIYPESIAASVPPERLKRFFVRTS